MYEYIYNIRVFLVSQLFNENYSYNKNMSIGEIIKSLRIESKMTQTELASLLFTSQDTISLWERDKSLPDVKSVIKMASIFKVTTDYILGVEK